MGNGELNAGEPCDGLTFLVPQKPEISAGLISPVARDVTVFV